MTTLAKNSMSALHPVSILVVEEQLAESGCIGSCLSSCVETIETAPDGVAGLELFDDGLHDIVISNVSLPDMNNLEMLRRVREKRPDTFIILASANSDETTLLTSIELGVDKFIKKPFDREDLLSAVEIAASKVSHRSRELEERLMLGKFLDHAPEFLISVDEQGIRYINKPFRTFIQAHEEENDPKRLMELINARIRNVPNSPLAAVGRLNRNWLGDICASGICDHLIAMTSPDVFAPPRSFLARVGRVNINGERVSVMTFVDVTELERQRDFYLELAFRDPLTGAANRKRFMDEMDRELYRSERYGDPLGIIFFDIDNFKRVNDVHGHLIGDHVLVETVQLASRLIRKSDVLVRFGGEEFVMVCPGTPLEGVKVLAEKLRKIIVEHVFDEVGSVSASFGVTEFYKGDSVNDIINRADSALYRAKQGGKNMVVAATPPERR